MDMSYGMRFEKIEAFYLKKYIEERLKYMIQALFKEFTITILE